MVLKTNWTIRGLKEGFPKHYGVGRFFFDMFKRTDRSEKPIDSLDEPPNNQ